jgi:hypothetical protein
MISWSRLLAGRLHDSLVGYHVLMGLVVGTAVALLHLLLPLVVAAFGQPQGPPLQFLSAGIESLRGPISSLGAILEVVVDFGRESMMVWMALVVIRLLLQSRTAAWIAFVLVFTLWYRPADSYGPLWDALQWASTAAMVTAFALCLVRFGLVSTMVGMILHPVLVGFPLTADPGAWYAGCTLLSFLIISSVTLSSYRCATRFAT